MDILPVASQNRQFAAILKQTLKDHFPGIRPVFFYTKKTFREYMSYETPELIIIHFADKPRTKFELLEEVQQDKWLNSAGIIAVHDEKEEEFLQKMRQSNLIAAVRQDDLEDKLPRIIKIVLRNRNILFQRALQSMFTGEIYGEFIIDNDLLDVQVHANLIVNFVANANHLDEEGKMGLKLVLQELLINAVEHGNCGMTFEEKTEVTLGGMGVQAWIREKMAQHPSIAAKKVKLEYRVLADSTWVRISDEGAGFDWRKKLDKTQDEEILDPTELLLHGRGIGMSRDLCRSVSYNEQGNVVEVVFAHNLDAKFIVPGFFEKDSETQVQKGDVVFRDGEESNFLYFIASGVYRVEDNQGNKLSTLNSSDIFMGEMSFLLYNQRTATVVCEENGVLYRIGKKNFVSAIKKLPYYSLMLCKILAKRLERVNAQLSNSKPS